MKRIETEPFPGDYSSGNFLKYLKEVKLEFAMERKKRLPNGAVLCWDQGQVTVVITSIY